MDFPSFLDVSTGCVVGSQLVYSQRYNGAHVLSPSEFQVPGGQLRIGAFGRRTCSASHLSYRPFRTTLVTGNALVASFYIMLIIYYNNHDLSGGLPFFCDSSI